MLTRNLKIDVLPRYRDIFVVFYVCVQLVINLFLSNKKLFDMRGSVCHFSLEAFYLRLRIFVWHHSFIVNLSLSQSDCGSSSLLVASGDRHIDLYIQSC